MEKALVKFVGSGLAAVSTGLGFSIPQSAIRNGYPLITYLSKHNAMQTGILLREIASDIWVNWNQGRVPRSAALAQLQALPIIISNHCPETEYFSNGLAQAASDAAKGKLDTASGGRLIAAEIIMRGREKNAFEKAGLNEQLAFFLMERLFVQLLLRFELLEELKPMLQSYFLNKLWRDPKTVETQVCVEELAKPVDLSETGEITTKSERPQAGPSAKRDKGGLPYRDEIDGISELQALKTASEHFAALLLEAGEGEVGTMHKLQLGRLRMRIGTQTKNIKTLQDARRLLEAGLAQPLLLDKAGIRRKAQIDLCELLWDLSKLNGDRALAVKAAEMLEPLCQSLRFTGGLDVWVNTHTLLASIYMGLSHDNAGTQELEKAAQYFEKASEPLSRTSQPVEWARLVNKLSYALELIAVRTKDADKLTQAAEVKSAALDVFEVHGDSKTLETIRDELYAIHDELQKLNRSEFHDLLSEPS